MYDLHCHLLHGIDDGAKTVEESVALARYAVASGITHTVLTPHLHLSRHENFANDIKLARDALQHRLDDEGIALQLGYAAEVRICPEIMQLLEQKKIPFLGEIDGYKVVLIEMPHNQLLPGWDNLFRWLIDNNIRPMVAHPERNKEIMATNEKILPIANSGAMIQLTAGAVAGQFGRASQATAKYILSQGLGDILATDAHNLKHRPPELLPGLKCIEEWVSESKCFDMVVNTPMSICSVQFDEIS